MQFRRVIALVVLFMTTASNLESVVGLLRDGRVHHESSVTAIAHSVQRAADHGHEDSGPASTQRHGKGHEHGTSTDHCTHQHGVAAVASYAFELASEMTDETFEERALHFESAPHLLTRPPRA